MEFSDFWPFGALQRKSLDQVAKLSTSAKERYFARYARQKAVEYQNSYKYLGFSKDEFIFDMKENAETHAIYPHFKRADFDLVSRINGTEGGMVEIGGPTNSGYKLINDKLSLINKKLIVTDLYNDQGVDAQVNARELPFSSNSLAVLLASCLSDQDARFGLNNEASRVLKPGGLLVLQGARDEDIYDAVKKHGMKVVEGQADTLGDFYHCVLEKPLNEAV